MKITDILLILSVAIAIYSLWIRIEEKKKREAHEEKIASMIEDIHKMYQNAARQ